MIVDETGILLVPGNMGRDCPGSGARKGVECCCDECDYLQCCLETHDPAVCLSCSDKRCLRADKR